MKTKICDVMKRYSIENSPQDVLDVLDKLYYMFGNDHKKYFTTFCNEIVEENADQR